VTLSTDYFKYCMMLLLECQWLIKGLEIAPDHVHVPLEHGAQTPIHEIAKAFKGRSSRILREGWWCIVMIVVTALRDFQFPFTIPMQDYQGKNFLT